MEVLYTQDAVNDLLRQCAEKLVQKAAAGELMEPRVETTIYTPSEGVLYVQGSEICTPDGRLYARKASGDTPAQPQVIELRPTINVTLPSLEVTANIPPDRTEARIIRDEKGRITEVKAERKPVR